jgi:uncharacterized membrane protein YhaH (DUF805 family)
VTDGGQEGTGGWPRGQWGSWLFILAVGVVITLVNATSEILEAQRDGGDLDPRAPFLWEVSSLILVVALAPFIGMAVRRWPPRRENWPRSLLTHAALTVPFSVLHVAGMVAIRKVGYALAGSFYDFSHGALGRELFYEWRKDVLIYALLAATYYVFQRHAENQAAKPAGDQRIEVRDGGAAVFLAPADILVVEAAGNYVEFHTPARTHLVRGTLASWESRLTQRGFVRVHRSRLVNRSRIAAIKPTPAGDIDIVLDDGRNVAGSRRYRANLEAASAGAAAAR